MVEKQMVQIMCEMGKYLAKQTGMSHVARWAFQ